MKDRLKKRNRLTIKQKLNKFLTKEITLMTGYQKLKAENQTLRIENNFLIRCIMKIEKEEKSEIASETLKEYGKMKAASLLALMAASTIKDEKK